MKQMFLPILIFLLLTACTNQEVKKDHSTQRTLFLKSLKLIETHKEKILSSENLHELDSLFADYEDKLGDLNMKFPRKTDFEMAENENDTLSNRILEMLNIRDSLKNNFIRPLTTPTDSTEISDSQTSNLPAQNL